MVLVDSRSGETQGVVAEGGDTPTGLDALLKLVCSSDPAVVSTNRVHDLALRALGQGDTDCPARSPCLFGNDVVAMVALPFHAAPPWLRPRW